MVTTKIAHVLTYRKPPGSVDCCTGAHSFDFFRTGTVKPSGRSTCVPSTKHFDLVLSNDSAVKAGAKLQITYDEQVPGDIKPIIALGITPAPKPHAFAFNVLGLIDIKSEIDTVDDADGEQAIRLLPHLKWRASITLFDRHRFAFETGRLSPEDEIARRYERDYLHIPPGSSAPADVAGESDDEKASTSARNGKTKQPQPPAIG